MNEMYFRISFIQRKIDKNNNLQMTMKVVAGLIVFCLFVCSLNQAETMKIAWMISIPVICLLFGFDTYYFKRNKEYEFELYHLAVDDLKRKKDLAKITGEVLSDVVLNREITVPNKELRLPIVFYVVMLVVDGLINILLIH